MTLYRCVGCDNNCKVYVNPEQYEPPKNCPYESDRKPTWVKNDDFMTERIIFYETDSWELKSGNNRYHKICYTYEDTKKVLSELKKKNIHTAQMCFLSDAGKYLEQGIRVFIHDHTGEYEIKLGTDNERTTRELRAGHDFFKLWENGEFSEPREIPREMRNRIYNQCYRCHYLKQCIDDENTFDVECGLGIGLKQIKIPCPKFSEL